MVTTTVSEVTYEDKDGKERTQYRTTVPKQIAETMDLGGEEIVWEVESSNAVTIRRVGGK